MRRSKRTIWQIIRSDENRRIISWLGGGLVVAIGAIWTWYTYAPARDSPSTNVGPGAINVPGTISNSDVKTNVKTK